MPKLPLLPHGDPLSLANFMEWFAAALQESQEWMIEAELEDILEE